MDDPLITHTITTHNADPGDPVALGRDPLLEREWLLTNGTGAYSMGTALGCNTRRYHGLLVAATRPPVGRVVALNQMLDWLELTDPATGLTQKIPLSCCRFQDDQGAAVFSPRGDEQLHTFSRGLDVSWRYRWGSLSVQRDLLLHEGEQAITLRYQIAGLDELRGDAVLCLSPMTTLRDFHELQHHPAGEGGFDTSVTKDHQAVVVRHGEHRVAMACSSGQFLSEPDWWYDINYPRDAYRGQGDREDYFLPGRFEVPLHHKESACEVTLTAALGDKPAKPRTTSGRRSKIEAAAALLPGDAPVRSALAIAADDFVVGRTIRKKKLSTLMAGYPWFADWGRDTFIALPGLLLCTGRHDEARDVLRAFAGAIRDGLVPNRFDDYDDSVAHYNTVDASLWYVNAGLAYIQASGQQPDWLIKAMRQIVKAYRQGTQAESHEGAPVPIAMDDDGLIAAGNAHSQLTWMDAACGGVVFTPRAGKCVEINALWYNALRGLAALLQTKQPKVAADYAKLAERVQASFVATFWSEAWQRLIDHVSPEGEADTALRPNQVFACSLTHSPLSLSQRQAVLASVRDKLLTPMGLRTLPPDDLAYHARYGGPQFDRDQSYHQGTVWPWLIGPYAEGVLRTGSFSPESKAEARAVLQPLLDRLMNQGLGQLHEIFDADATPGLGPGNSVSANDTSPKVSAATCAEHAPRGCVAQAWSIAELIRVLALS